MVFDFASVKQSIIISARSFLPSFLPSLSRSLFCAFFFREKSATPSNLLALRADLAEVSLQIDAEEDLFVRKGVAIKYLRKALKKKEADTSRLRQAVDARDNDIRNLRDRMDSVHRVLAGITVH